MKTCKQCQQSFEITPEEQTFREKLSPVVAGQRFTLPEPEYCSSCRRQRRCLVRNDRKFYKRTCDKTGKIIISLHHAGKPFPVYAQDVWWTDVYDPLAYGQDFDFSRPFFEQFAELSNRVPRAASSIVNSENCDYTALTIRARNSYLSSRLGDAEDIYYSYLALHSKSCFDCYNITHCELNYESIDNRQCYQCFFSERCKGSNDLWFCADMSGCKDCFACVGLVQKQYCFFNEPLSKTEYQKKIKEWWDGSQGGLERCMKAFREFQKKCPVRATTVFNSENVLGSSVFESRNVFIGFDIVSSEDAMYCTMCDMSKDTLDCDFTYYGERYYYSVSSSSSMNVYFSFMSLSGTTDVYYSMEVFNNSQNLFGCIGMKKNQYCILNKQYTKEEWETLVPRIITHMQETGEWGQYFPPDLSAYGYNETVSGERFPLSREAVLQRGWNWYDEPEETVQAAPGENIVTCEVSGKFFRLLPQELQFYKQMNIPLPTRHPDVRHRDRLAQRSPYWLRPDTCKKCGKNVWTDQDTDRLIYCQECYLSFVY